jgi:hypothetical protein
MDTSGEMALTDLSQRLILAETENSSLNTDKTNHHRVQSSKLKIRIFPPNSEAGEPAFVADVHILPSLPNNVDSFLDVSDENLNGPPGTVASSQTPSPPTVECVEQVLNSYRKPSLQTPLEPQTRPRLPDLFQKHGVILQKSKRPLLQFPELATAAGEKDAKFDVLSLHEEFVEALKWDGDYQWGEENLTLESPIDLYFVQKQDEYPQFLYNPKNEASAEYPPVGRKELDGRFETV